VSALPGLVLPVASLPFAPDPVAATIAALALGAVLLVSAAFKLADLATFTGLLDDYRLLPRGLARPAAVLVAGTETAAGLMLVVGPRDAGAVVGAALLLVVTGAVVINLLRGRRDIRCGCGAPHGRQTLGWGLPARNAVLLAAAAVAGATPEARALGFADVVTIAGGALALAGLYFTADQLMANRPTWTRTRG
jgi:hypothetical protein